MNRRHALRKALLRSAFFVSATFALLTTTVQADSCSLSGEKKEILIETVVDGDTLRARRMGTLRLAGINTPERDYKDRYGAPLAERAYERLEQLVNDANEIQWVDARESPDRYGRDLGYLILDGRFVAEILVAEGLAWTIAIEPNVELVDCLAEVEETAREQQLGIWRNEPTRAERVVESGFDLVYGEVTRVDTTRRYLYLEVDDALVVRLARKGLSRALESQLKRSEGEWLEARGWVIDRQRGNLKPGHKRFMLPLKSSHLLLIQDSFD